MVKTSLINTVILLLLLLSSGCKKNSPTEPQPTKPPGYQEDIPWPSLADSPWPMYRADPQNTGRSKYSGAINGVLDWQYDSIDTQSGIVVNVDTSVIVGSSNQNEPYLYGISNGTVGWKTTLGQIFNTPTIAKDNSIYTISGNKIYNLTPHGSINSVIPLVSSYAQKAVYLGKDGNIYYVGINKLYALDKLGNFLWSLDNNTGNDLGNELCFSPDGNSLYINGMSLTSVDLVNRKINWTYGNNLTHSAMVDAQGNIYFHAQSDSGIAGLVSLKPDKTLRWIFDEYVGKGAESYLSIDFKGNIYFDDNNNLYSLNYYGTLNWKKQLRGTSSGFIAIDNRGIIYSCCQKDDKIALTSYDEDGNAKWSYTSIESVTSGNGIAVGYDRIYLPTWDSKIIYSFR